MTYFPTIQAASLIETIQTTGFWNGKAGYVWHILGRRAGFTSTSVLNDVKEFDNGVADYPELSNSTLDIISSSANDTNTAGTGVRQVKVVYLNASNVLTQSPAINLNGTGLVTSVLTGVNSVLWMEAVVTGTGNVAAGNIRLRINGGTVEVEQITAGGNKSLSARMRVPAGYTGYIVSWDGSAIGNTMDLRIRAGVDSFTRAVVAPYHFMDNSYLASGANFSSEMGWRKIPATGDIKVSVIAGGTAGTNRTDVSFTVVLIAD
jgi:hypothetical protein